MEAVGQQEEVARQHECNQHCGVDGRDLVTLSVLEYEFAHCEALDAFAASSKCLCSVSNRFTELNATSGNPFSDFVEIEHF